MKQGRSHYSLIYVLMVAAQLLICNYLHLSQYVMLSILPVIVLCIPTRYSSFFAMVTAFATGLIVDMLVDGVLGLNAVALVPVAYLRRPVIQLIFGDELFARDEDFSIRKHGFGKVFTAVFIVQALFLVIYIRADGAGTRPLWFDAARFGASLSAGLIASLLIIDVLAPDEKK